jgi:Flp pilus assembly pilin Flp
MEAGKMKTKMRQLGQGMTEYIIIVALIAIAAIAVYGFFGDTIRSQVGAMTAELAGGDSSGAKKAADTAGENANTEGTNTKTLQNFNQ